MKVQESFEALAQAYLAAYRQSTYPEAILEKIEVSLKDFPTGLVLIQALITETKTNEELAYVAAGPLEDFYKLHFKTSRSVFETLLKTDAKLRRAFTGVWASERTEVRVALEKLLNKYQLIYSSL